MIDTVSFSLNLEELGFYLLQKQSLSKEFKGIHYKQAIEITKNLLYFLDQESLHARMRTYSSSLLDSLLRNNLVIQAPFISNNLTYISKDYLPFYYYENYEDNYEYKNTKTRSILEYIKGEGSTTRQKIIEQFDLNRDLVMEILTDLRSNLRILMFFDGNSWLVYDPIKFLEEKQMSKTKAIQSLIFETIKNYGPITVPQIMKILQLSGGKVSTSLIDLYEEGKIVRGNFIENSTYEAFLDKSELDQMERFKKEILTEEKKEELSLLPENDPLVKYWGSADFMPLNEVKKYLVLTNGVPVCSFNYKLISNKLQVQDIRKTKKYDVIEKEIRDLIQEFAENKGKELVFPHIHSELMENQTKTMLDIMKQRGYGIRNEGVIYRYSGYSSNSQGYSVQYSWEKYAPLLLKYQSLHKLTQKKTRVEILKLLSSVGIPLPISSLITRINTGKQSLIETLLINNQIVVGKYGGLPHGLINTKDYNIYTKLSPKRHIGTFEERILKLIKQREKLSAQQIKSKLNLSLKLLYSSLSKLEHAHRIVKTKTSSGKLVWMDVDAFLKNQTLKNIKSQKEAWIEIIHRILSSNLPLTINQLANITGLSNTQIEMYLKEMIAAFGVKSGRYIEEINEVQFTTKTIENELMAFVNKEGVSTGNISYLPRNDPLIVLYKNIFIKRFKIRKLFLRPLPDNYAELVLKNGLPMAAIHYKQAKKIDYINNIELLAEYNDVHSLIMLFSSIDEYHKKRNKTNQPVLIKQINGEDLKSSSVQDIANIIRDMQLNFQII